MAAIKNSPWGIMYGAVGFVAGLFLMYKGFKWFQRKRLIEDIPTSKVRGIAMGLVEVAGKARPVGIATMHKAPLSGKKCVYYKYKVEKLVSSGKSSRWRTIRKGHSPEPFFVEDNTGKVLVDPKYAELSVPSTYKRQSKWGRDPDPAVVNFLKAESIRFEGFMGMNYTMRYREWAIYPNKHLYVIGTAGKNPHIKEGTAVKGVHNVMIKKGGEKVMMISTGKEKQVLSSLKWKAIGGLLGGGLLSLVCLILIIAALNV